MKTVLKEKERSVADNSRFILTDTAEIFSCKLRHQLPISD
jgi:hypothetical protein